MCIEVKSLSFITLHSKTLFVAGAVKEVNLQTTVFLTKFDRHIFFVTESIKGNIFHLSLVFHVHQLSALLYISENSFLKINCI